MGKIIYQWNRFWSSREAHLDLTDGGYLTDPEEGYGRYINPALVRFSEISGKQCLALLGEPGMGKTQALEAIYEECLKIQGGNGELVRRLNLRSFGNEQRLIDKLFRSEWFLEWKNSSRRLHLFLDSLDEGLMGIEKLASLIPDELRDCPTDRLSLRIACRTAVWPRILESELLSLWPEAEVGIFELAPLRRRDIDAAARAEGISSSGFLDAVEKSEAVAFAIRPVTLKMLLNIFKLDGRFPTTRWDFYEKGTRLLAEEISESRLASRQTGALTADQRLAIASRIAAVTLFSNFFAVLMRPDLGDAPLEAVSMRELSGQTEIVQGNEFEVSDLGIRETIDTGLFSSRGESLMGWAHQTYPEFLAAKYLTDHTFTQSQILSLLRHPGTSTSKIVPQLAEVAAWLATKRKDIFDAILPADPSVLLRSDISTADDVSREKLTAALLTSLEEHTLHDLWSDFDKHYRKLSHPQLAGQLRPYIVDSNKGVIARRVALFVAHACLVKELAPDLLTVIFDTENSDDVRAQATRALVALDDEQAIITLKPLVTGENAGDTGDELRGSVLSALWPKHLTATELFEHLPSKKQSGIIGSYSLFLTSGLALHLDNPGDFLVALQWVVKREEHFSVLIQHGDLDFARLSDRIVLTSFENGLGFADVRSMLAKVLIQRLRAYHLCLYPDNAEQFKDELTKNASRRRLLVECFAQEMNEDLREAFAISRELPPEDFDWLLQKATDLASKEDPGAKRFALLTRTASVNLNDSQIFERIYYAAQMSEFVKEQFAHLLEPVDLQSETAKEQRRLYELVNEPAREQPPPLDLALAERIEDLLDQAQAKSSEAFWRLNWLLAADPQGRVNGEMELQPDLTALPGWKALEKKDQDRLVKAARLYLEVGTPGPNDWIRNRTMRRPAFAGYRALRLLKMLEEETYRGLPPEVWSRWSDPVVGFPAVSGESEVQRELIGDAYERAPKEVLAALNALVEIAIQSKDGLALRAELSKMTKCWSGSLEIGEALRRWLHTANLNAEHVGVLVGELVAHQGPDAFEIARQYLVLPIPQAGLQRTLAQVVCRELIATCQPAEFQLAWSFVLADEAFGKEVFLDLAKQPTRGLWRDYSGLHDEQLADMFIWLEGRFPRKDDPARTVGGHYMEPLDTVAELRDGCLTTLVSRGTVEAVEQLKRIRQSFPGLDWMYVHVLNAEANMMRATWTPPAPAHILLLARNSKARLVNNAVEFLETILESLHRLQELDLKAQTPRAPFLWDELPGMEGSRVKRYRPKEEVKLSDYIKGFVERDLKQNGIIVNREVEVSGPLGLGKTDIHIDAIIKERKSGQFERLKAVIEVKGCWNMELLTALQGQLVEKYLSTADCRSGIYLVAWFGKDRWDSGDYRRGHAPNFDIEQARAAFSQQATDKSKDDLIVRSFILDCNY
jgi:predicted NACHT family NTPase